MISFDTTEANGSQAVESVQQAENDTDPLQFPLQCQFDVKRDEGYLIEKIGSPG